VRAQPFGERLGLSETGRVERSVGVPLQPPLAVPIGLAMAKQKQKALHAVPRNASDHAEFLYPP